MKETYGILGSGFSSKAVIEASLNDIGTKTRFVVPWYGQVTDGLEVVYDWLLDNAVEFHIVYDGTKMPKALSGAAENIIKNGNIDQYIMDELQYTSSKGIATILWDDQNDSISHKLAEGCITRGIPTLELTNGLVPIIIDSDDQVDEEAPKASAEEDDTEDFDEETIQQMPEKVRQRVNKNKSQDAPVTEESPKQIIRVIIEYTDGSKVEIPNV